MMTSFAVWRAKGRSVRITTDSAHRLNLNKIDGLILGGGSDIDPENYGEEFQNISKTTGGHNVKDKLISIIMLILRIIFSIKVSQPKQDSKRDKLEKKLCLEALKQKIPILGICRGAQMINICLGGTLYQTTNEFYTETPHIKTILPQKKVYIKDKSILQLMLGVKSCFVNSLHDQAIHCLGKDLIVTAHEKNGIIQGIESTSNKFIIGVQWHPEYLPQSHQQQSIFKGLIKTANENMIQ